MLCRSINHQRRVQTLSLSRLWEYAGLVHFNYIKTSKKLSSSYSDVSRPGLGTSAVERSSRSVFCGICQGLLRRSNEVCGMKAGAGVSRSLERGTTGRGLGVGMEGEEKRGALCPIPPPLQARPRASELIRGRERPTETDSEFLSSFP